MSWVRTAYVWFQRVSLDYVEVRRGLLIYCCSSAYINCSLGAAMRGVSLLGHQISILRGLFVPFLRGLYFSDMR